MKKTIITVFTDPMMGLSYESEPILERLQNEYKDTIVIRYVMSILVRDVLDFMLPEERMLDLEEGIKKYNKRLAGIYKSEESIGGLPINMDGFRLFDTEHRSSKPLCLAYKAAQLTNPDKADAFLKALRHATVLCTRPTTHLEEILRIIRNTKIDEKTFLTHYQDGTAEIELNKDKAFTNSLQIHSLPAYLIQHGDQALIMHSFQYQDFVDAIAKISN